MYDFKLDKDEKHKTILTVGRNRITRNYDISTPTTELTTVKLLLNSVISISKTKFMKIDINTFIYTHICQITNICACAPTNSSEYHISV